MERDAAAAVDFVHRSPTDRQARAAVAAYFGEINRRFDTGFDPGEAATTDAETMTPPRGVFLVAVADGEPVACGGVRRLDERTIEIKRMWVHDDWRGAGLGTRLLRLLEEEAAMLGGERIVLDTNRTLVEAMAMYERAGYHEIEAYAVDNPYAEAWFEKPIETG